MVNNEIEKLLPRFEDGVYYGLYENETYETAYQTSKLRENLINWYPFEKDATVLAISHGTGALIPYLCQNTGHVTIFEEHKENCLIIKKRCKNFKNFKVVQDDFMSCSLLGKYNYILVIDYLTTHLKNSSEDNFFEKFLTKICCNLCKDGKLLMAVNNSLGLRYLNGAFCQSEKMLLFDSLNQSDFFTKTDLEMILKKVGLKYYKFYYPFPDFSFPRSIYTDEALKIMRYGHHYSDYCFDRYQFFDEFKMYHKLQMNGIVEKFSNSFFIEVGKEPLRENYIIYAKNQYFIDKKAKTVTVLYSGEKKGAEKKALTSEAKEYLWNLYNDSIKLNAEAHCFNYISYSFNKELGILRMPYIDGMSLSDQLEKKLYNLSKQHNKKCIYNEIIAVFSGIYVKMKEEAVLKNPSEIFDRQFENNFGSVFLNEPLYCLNPVTLDLHLDHIFPNANGYDVIDVDPIKFFNVPIDYLMWCLIESWHYTYIYKNKKLEQSISVHQICSDLGINVKYIEIFKKWRLKVFNNQSAVSQIQPFYSQIYSPIFLPYDKLERYGVLRNSDSRVMNAMNRSKIEVDTFRITKKTSIILYGAAAVGKLFYNILSKRGYQVIAFMDKRYDEISDIDEHPVLSIDEKTDLHNCVIIVAIKNVFEQEQIARALFKRGYTKLIYRPQKIIEGEKDECLQILNNVYDEIERFKWISDSTIPLNFNVDIPETKEFDKISLKDCALKLTKGSNVIANIPLMHIYTAQKQIFPDYPWAEKNVISLLPHTALYKYLWDGGENKTEWYIDFCSYGARNNHIEITKKWKENLINNRLTVLYAMKKSLEQDFDFFYRNPPEGLWNERRKYFNLNGGRHRAALFVYQNFYTMPLEISKNEYDKYLNLPVIAKIENYMNETNMDYLEVPVSHPYFFNLSSRRPQYYQCVIKPIIEFVSQDELNKHGIIQFEKINFKICAEDYGELKRCLYKSGFSVFNIAEELVFEQLLDELFYTEINNNYTYSKNYFFFDCSLKGLDIIPEEPLYWNTPNVTMFFLIDSKNTAELKKILEKKGFKIMITITKCYWDTQEILLLAVYKEK